MKFDPNLNESLKAKIVQSIEKAPANEKADKIYEGFVEYCEAYNTAVHGDLIAEIVAENEKAAISREAKRDYEQSQGIHALTKEETEFYQMLIDPKQAVTFTQNDVLPETIVNRTMEDIRKKSDLLSLVKFAPAGVTKWISGSHSGKAVWGDYLAAISGEISANIASLDLSTKKMTAYMVIPKAIREVALPFVDKYFKAVLGEAVQDGLEEGYLNGDGKTGPIGIMKTIAGYASDGTAKAKPVSTKITTFSPKGLVEVRKTLSNDGKRTVPELALICNPLDEAEYVDPCMYGRASNGAWVNVSFMPIKKYVTPIMPKGKGVFTIPDAYTMGIHKVGTKEYDQTKAMEDQDLLVTKVYANGRADDDNTAYVFDITKLEEYIPAVETVAAAASAPAKA